MNFSAEDRQRFAALADVLIPADDRMPSASQADVAGQWLDAVLAARPDLIEPLKSLLDKFGFYQPQEFIDQLRNTDRAALDLLLEIVPNAYFMNPAVQQALGYAGQGPRSMDPRADYMEDGLLESVIRRGPIYRPTPADDVKRKVIESNA
jgi:hypothetical protein